MFTEQIVSKKTFPRKLCLDCYKFQTYLPHLILFNSSQDYCILFQCHINKHAIFKIKLYSLFWSRHPNTDKKNCILRTFSKIKKKWECLGAYHIMHIFTLNFLKTFGNMQPQFKLFVWLSTRSMPYATTISIHAMMKQIRLYSYFVQMSVTCYTFLLRS